MFNDLCKNGIALIKEIHGNYLDEYNYELIKEISKEINSDTEKILRKTRQKKLSDGDKAGARLLILRAAKNKRCILAYMKDRVEKVEKLHWTLTGYFPQQIKKNYDDIDFKYREQYNTLIDNYSKMLSLSDMDLTKDYLPPRELCIEVRAIENIKDVQTHNGKMNFEKNHVYYLKRRDVEHYIRAGFLVITE